MSYLTEGERFIFNWQYRLEDENSFKGLLAKLLSKADSNNLRKISQGFPDEANAMYNFHNTDGWWAKVEDKGMNEKPFKNGSKYEKV